MSSISTTPPAAAPATPSTKMSATPMSATPYHVEVGDTVLVKIDQEVRRPMIVSTVELIEVGLRDTPTAAAQDSRRELRVSGTIFADPLDHTAPAFRGAVDRQGDPARITGRPDRMLSQGYGEHLAPGMGIGQWIPKPARIPSGGR